MVNSSFASGTWLYYNGVVIRDCQIEGFDQQVQLDDSQTDVMFTRVKIQVSGIVTGVGRFSASNLPTDGTEPPTTVWIENNTPATTVDRMKELQHRLSENRKDFAFGVHDAGGAPGAPYKHFQILIASTGTRTGNTSTTFSIPGYDGTEHKLSHFTNFDCDAGPKVRGLQLTDAFGGTTFLVKAEFEIARRFCDPPVNVSDWGDPPLGSNLRADDPLAGGNPYVLSNRWGLTESKGADLRTTRTLEGQLRIANHTLWAHAMRYLVVPPLPRFYRRTNQEFAVDKSGLNLHYRVTDTQEHAAPPAGCVDWDGTYTESTGPQFLAQRGEVSCWVQGEPGCDKQNLIRACFLIARSRINGLQFQQVAPGQALIPQVIVQHAAVIEHLKEPRVELRVSVNYHAEKNQLPTSLALRLASVGASLYQGYDQGRWPVPSLYDSLGTPVGNFACYLQEPCSPWHGIDQPQQLDATRAGFNSSAFNSIVRRIPGNVTITQVDQVPTAPFDSPSVESGQKQADFPYSHYEIDSRYEFQGGRVMLPFSRPLSVQEQTRFQNWQRSPLHNQVFQLFATNCVRHYTITCRRRGNWPQIPPLENFITQAPRFGTGSQPLPIYETLLDHEINVASPTVENSKRSHVYELQIHAKYALSRPPTPADNDALRGGATPFSISTPVDNWAPFNGVTGIIETTGKFDAR